MAEAKHTPGPWQVHGSHVYTADPERAMLAQVFNPGRTAQDFPLVANADLIAAAPDMLDALRDALEFVADQEDVSDGPDGQQVPNRAMSLAQTLRAVIKKAGGVA